MIDEIQARTFNDSVQWFPHVHSRPPIDQLVHWAMGLGSEVGDLMHLLQRANGGDWPMAMVDEVWLDCIGHEVADAIFYLFNICTELGIGVARAIETKRQLNIDRFGEVEP